MQLAIVVLVVAFVSGATYLGFQPERAGRAAVLGMIGGPYLALAVVGIVRAKRDGVLEHWARVRGGDFTIGFASAGALFGLSWAFIKVMLPPGSPREGWLARIYLTLGDPELLRARMVLVVAALVALAVCEEIVWRGLVVSLLEEKVGTSRAWLYSPVLYAVAHVPTAWALRDEKAGLNPLLPLAALACGLVWGFMGRRLGRLAPGVFSHALFLWCVTMMFRLWGPGV